MFNVRVKIIKEYTKVTSEKGEEVNLQGVRIVLGPKVEKFICFENLTTGKKSNIDLLGYTNPNLVQWYMNSNVGQEIILQEIEPEHVDNFSQLGYKKQIEVQ